MQTARLPNDFGRFTPIITFIGVLWVVHIANYLLGYQLNHRFGLEPLSIGGLIGILAAPFLHGSFGHVAANSVPLLILGGLTLVSAPKRFWEASIGIVILGGALTWVLGGVLSWILPFVPARSAGALHVGASGLVFGYFGFLLMLGVLERRLMPVLAGLATLALYGGMFFALFKFDARVSVEMHIFGFLAGIVMANFLRLPSH